MAPPGSTTEPNDEKVDEPWKPPQRPGKLGEDYDELGKEMAPNARVWKKYVEETDKTDKELVEGWNNSLDIILLFAALFSAISTAFVIESSKDLKPDYSQTSTQTLQLMSRTLSAIARGSPLNDSDSMTAEVKDFMPSSSAIAVNTLWFLSLGLSVAVSLIAILAKEWCHSFMAGRVGSMLRQARLRQQRWDGIEQWKMKEILYVLPLLMHIALLLFAVGLSLYLWDIDMRVALPVVITTSLAALFYIATVSLPLFFRFCPYTTALARFLYPYWLALLDNRHTMDIIGAFVACLGWISHTWVHVKHTINHRARPTAQATHHGDDIEATGDSQLDTSPFLLRNKMEEAHDSIQKWVESMRAMFSTDRSQLVERDTPMDRVTSSMIAWMIVHCEDSKSVDTALQALAGAEWPLPRLPLWECGAIDLLCLRIDDCASTLMSIHDGLPQLARDALLDDASLCSRSFNYLTTFIAGEGLDMTKEPKLCFTTNDDHELLTRLQLTAERAHGYIRGRLDEILNYTWHQSSPRYELAAYEFNVVPAKASMDVWGVMESFRGQCQKQQELVQHITSGKVTNLPPSAIDALVHGITKTYLYNTSQSPMLLVDLLGFLDSQRNSDSKHVGPLAVGLAVIGLVVGSYTAEHNIDNKIPTNEPRIELLANAYTRLAAESQDFEKSLALLSFGLLSLLDNKTEGKWALNAAEIKLIGEHLDRSWMRNLPQNMLPGILPPSFDCDHYLVQVLSDLISTFLSDIKPGISVGSTSPVLLRLEAALSPSLCRASGNRIVPLLIQHFAGSDCAQLKQLCLRGIEYSLRDWSDRLDIVLDSLVQTALLKQVMEFITSTRDGPAMIPYCMKFLWMAGLALLDHTELWVPGTRRSAAQSLLQSLENPFTAPSTEGGFLNNCDAIGLANLWLPKIDEICHSDPQIVLDSNLLSVMIDFYEYEEHRNAKPRTTELPRAFDRTWTWLRILRHWESNCQEAVKQQANSSALPDEKAKSDPTICGAEIHEGEGRSRLDVHDWSI